MLPVALPRFPSWVEVTGRTKGLIHPLIWTFGCREFLEKKRDIVQIGYVSEAGQGAQVSGEA